MIQRYLFDPEDSAVPAPEFRLRSTEGDWIERSEFRGLKNLVLCFPARLRDDEVAALAASFSAQSDAYAAQDCMVLLILPRPGVLGPEDHAFPLVLVDSGRSVEDAYSALLPIVPTGEPLIVVLDRFGGPSAAFTGFTIGGADLHSQILSRLQYIEIQCPE